jgi:hypothetical protein
MDVQRQRISLWVASLAAGLTAWIASFQPSVWPVAVASWVVTLIMAATVAKGGTGWRRAIAIVLVVACGLGALATVALALWWLQGFKGG